MVELLTLLPVTKIDEISKEVPPPASGLPINSLPGWDRVPLCNKLPMLNTPTNEIIFSREKIGKRLWKPSEFVLYDPNCYMVKLDYDPLHDPHLKNFYSRPVNFKRLKEIGRVTDNQDVICTLKEFNSYRQYIRRLHIDLINNEVEKLQMNRRDMFLLQIAEEVASKHVDRMKNTLGRTSSEVIRVKQLLDEQRRDKALQAVNQSQQIFERIFKLKQLRKEKMHDESQMRKQIIQHRINCAKDAETLRIIALQNKFKKQDIKIKKFLHKRQNDMKEFKMLKAQADWQKRVEYRAWKQGRIEKIRFQASLLKKNSVEKHKKIMQKKWNRIQNQIANKTMRRHQKDAMKKLATMMHRRLQKSAEGKTHRRSYQNTIDRNSLPLVLDEWKHSIQEIKDAISTALSLHNGPLTDRICNEKILRNAKYILEKVLESVTRNLGQDLQAREYMYRRIGELFARVKKHVLLKIERVLQASDEVVSRRSSQFGITKSCPLPSSLILPLWSKSLANSMSKTVSFGQIEAIGKTAQEIDSNVELRSVKSRTPTPGSSFTSVNAMVKETCSKEDVQIPIRSHEANFKLPNLTASERIFVEHFYIKFKKSLLVGVERAVFDAIDLKKRELRFTSRREILELDRKYLTNIMAESILTYNLNSYNYYGNTRLCISVLAAECLYDLQDSPLTPKYDPSHRVEPRCRCNIGAFGRTCEKCSKACRFI